MICPFQNATNKFDYMNLKYSINDSKQNEKAKQSAKLSFSYKNIKTLYKVS